MAVFAQKTREIKQKMIRNRKEESGEKQACLDKAQIKCYNKITKFGYKSRKEVKNEQSSEKISVQFNGRSIWRRTAYL